MITARIECEAYDANGDRLTVIVNVEAALGAEQVLRAAYEGAEDTLYGLGAVEPPGPTDLVDPGPEIGAQGSLSERLADARRQRECGQP